MTATTPVSDDIDQDVAREMRCKCVKFPDYPCENEFDGIDELCGDCRPRCRWGNQQLCCGRTISCTLIPLVGTECKVHAKEISWGLV
jgi:hypothetical protein